MANQIINVIVNSKGAVTVKRELDAMGDSARQTTTYLNGLRAVLAAALTFSGASAIIETVDNFTVLQNRLKQVQSETETLADSWSRLMGIANSSYSTIDSTVNLYFRVAQAYKAWGESAEQAYEFTDLFQKAAILSGSSMQSTAQAVYQFGQALNKGKLDGDEFKSVLENLPYVASLLQKSLGVTRAELYQMSADGKISVQRIKEAFEDAAKTIRGDWQNITPTIGMALIVLKNNWTDFIGSIQTSTGIFSGFAQLILLIANNFNLLAIAMAPVAISFAFLAGRMGIGLVVIGLRDLSNALGLATAAQWLFNAAVSMNPFVLIGIALVAAVAAIVYFRNEIGLTDAVLTSMWTNVTAVFSAVMDYLSPITSMIVTVVSWFLRWNLVFMAIRALVNLTREDITSMFKAVSTVISQTVAYLSKALWPLFEELINIATSFGKLIVEIAGFFMDLLGPAVEAYFGIYKKMWEYVKPSLNVMLEVLKEIYAGWKIIGSWLADNFLPTIKKVFEGWIWILQQVLKFINDIISALRLAVNLMKAIGGGGSGGGGGGKAPGANYGAQFYAGEFNNGGGFKVGGTGNGRDTTPVAFRANRGERVTVETKKQQRVNDNQPAAANVNVPVSVINIFDPSAMPAANMSHTGQRSIVNAITVNRDEIAAILGVY